MKTVVIILMMTTIYATCRKNCADTSYSFNLNAHVHPDKESVHIGDTLWLYISTPTTLLDNISGKTIDHSRAKNLGISISFLSFHGGSISDPGASYVLDSFQYVLVNGSSYTTSQFADNYLFSEFNNSYQFKLGIISKRTGTFALTTSDATGVYTANNRCSKASFLINYIQTDQHLYLYQNSRPGYQIIDYESTHLYCFEVY